MSAKFNKNGVINCAPIDGYDKVSIMKNDIIVGENLIGDYDSSFSTYEKGNIDLFINQMNATVQEIVEIDGERCIHFNTGDTNDLGRVYRTISISANKTYTLSALYLSPKIYSQALRIELFGGDYNWDATVCAYTEKNKWQKLSITITPTSDTTLFYFFYTDVNNDIYIKKIKLEEGSKPTPWCPNPSAGFGNTPDTYKNPIQAKDFIEL